MKKLLTTIGLAAAALAGVHAQTSFTSTANLTAWNAARWNNSADAAPFSATYTANNNVNFTSGNYTIGGMGSSINVGNITVSSGANVTFSAGSTFATGGNVRTITVGSGSLFDFNGQQISTAVGTGFIIAGSGVFGTGTYSSTTNAQSFTINSGTVIVRGTTGLGNGANSVLNLNGGTVASNGNRDLANTRFGGGINIGGDVQFGALAANVVLASDTANLSFANNVSLGAATRTFTQGNNGTNTFSGIISNTSGGLTFAANVGTDGRFEITNTANTFTGDININGGEVRFTVDGSIGNAANDIIIDGGRFAKASDATTVVLGVGRQISVGDGVGTSISSPGAGTLTYDGVIANKTGETGSWAKQGSGTLELGGVSTYTGNTSVNNGILRLTTGDNRLPTGTVVSLGQAASANLGILDLNGRNQQIAGLQSTTGTNAGSNTNNVTSSTAATLTINNTSDFAYSDGTAANSGVISGSISLVKEGPGSQTLGGVNTYSGGTTLTAGTLIVASDTALGAASGDVIINGSDVSTLQFNAGISIANDVIYSNASSSVDTYIGASAPFRTGTDGVFTSSFVGGTPDTAASFLFGADSGSGTILSMGFASTSTATNDANRLSDVFSLTGTDSDVFVLQLNVSGLGASAFLGWHDLADLWVVATSGNSAAGGLAGFYSDSFSTFVTNNGGWNPTTMLGAYGNDGTGNVWAVLDHNSDFAAIPEPGTWTLISIGSAFLLYRSRRRKA